MNVIVELFLAFLQIGVLSFGGGYAVMPLIQQQISDQRGWITLQEYTDIITISQMTPGPLTVNTSSFVGMRIAGLAGGITATLGCVLPGVIMALLLSWFFMVNRKNAVVMEVLNTLKAASTGLIAAAAASIMLLALFNDGIFNIIGILMFAVSLLLLRRFKTNPLLIMLLSGIAGLVLY